MPQHLSCIIVDDSLFIRETVSALINNTDHEVIATYEDGKSFLKQYQILNPDVVLLDVILPEISGLEVLNVIKKEEPEIKVIMLSGVAQSDAISTALRLGALDFLQKPVSTDRLELILDKISGKYETPSMDQLSTVGVGCLFLTNFLEELLAHSTPILQVIIKQQIRAILEDVINNTENMFIIDILNLTIKIDPMLFGIHTEEDILSKLHTINEDLKFELHFLYSEEFIDNLIAQSMLTMISKPHIARLCDVVSPSVIGLPDIPDLEKIDIKSVGLAATSFEELSKAISIAVLSVHTGAPEILVKINDLMDDVEYMRNSIFFFQLVGQGDAFQEGLFGPLPVTSSKPLSSLVYSSKLDDQIILFCFYYTEVAEKIVADYNRISFIIKTRLSSIQSIDEINRGLLTRILDDITEYLLES